MKEIKLFVRKSIKNLIMSILKSNKIAKFIEKNLKEYIENNKKNIKKTEHLNII